jgi:hypothetical protein
VSYWVDDTPNGQSGELIADDEYVDAAHKAYFAVNSVSATNHTAQLTIASRKIDATWGNLGPTTGDYDDEVTPAGDLSVNGSGAPVANQQVQLSIGSQSCTATTDASGHAACGTPIKLTQAPGSYKLSASFAGDAAYAAATASTSFTLTREETRLSYLGPFHVVNGTPATFTATLREDGTVAPTPAGQTVTFTLGTGATAQTCKGMVTATSDVGCVIQNVQQPDSGSFGLPVSAAFAGDTYYEPGSASATTTLLYYTGRGYGARASLGSGAPKMFADTGNITTAQLSHVRRSTLSASAGVLGIGVTVSGVTAQVNTGSGTSATSASVASFRIGGLSLPTISVSNVSTTSQTTCQAAKGTSTLGSLTINGVSYSLRNAAPNTRLSVAGLTITLNEEHPVADAGRGLTVNAIHIVKPGVVDVVVGSATSDIHNCT